MRFEVYCDESYSDVFTSNKPKAQYLMIGSLWLPKNLRKDLKDKINIAEKKYGLFNEFKWNKVKKNHLPFYKALIDIFISYENQLRFRCIAVDRTQVNLKLHDGDAELGFYKFYYQLLHHWILDFNEYDIFCDIKTNRDPKRLDTLKQCLNRANMSSQIHNVQSLDSKQVVLIQLSDLLLGCASARINHTLQKDSTRSKLVEYLEKNLGKTVNPTSCQEQKFNIFKINLNGGW